MVLSKNRSIHPLSVDQLSTDSVHLILVLQSISSLDNIPHPCFQVVVSPQYSGINAPTVLEMYLDYGIFPDLL